MTTKLILDLVTKVYGTGRRCWRARYHYVAGRCGQLMAIVGPSGSGKTTFLAIAGALLSPTRGRVILDGRAPTGLTPTALAGCVSARSSSSSRRRISSPG